MNPYDAQDSPVTDRKRRRHRFMIVAFLVYVLAYGALSRNGFEKSDAMELTGMWFFTPDDGEQWRLPHYTCVVVFAPLIAIDNLVGTGRPVCNEPMWSLE